jgi:hypothetical protein
MGKGQARHAALARHRKIDGSLSPSNLRETLET